MKWMLMTYYCPTHGDANIVHPPEKIKQEMRESHSKKGKAFKN